MADTTTLKNEEPTTTNTSNFSSNSYNFRILDDQLKDKLSYKSAVVIRGPKWCGKTTTAAQIAKSALYMQDPDAYAQNIAMSELAPSRLLQGDFPRLIDEWQEAPALWDAVRFAVDKDTQPGRFILTGSAVPGKRQPRHSGTGRFGFLTMRTMSLFESGESNGSVSLAELFAGEKSVEGESSVDIEEAARITARGGWPLSVVEYRKGNHRESFAIAKDYLDAVCEEDISRADGVSRNPTKARALIRAYARCSSSQAPNNTLQEDMRSVGESLSAPTLTEYLDALNIIRAVEDLPAWSPKLRLKTPVRTSPTRHLSDPSIAVAALGASPDMLLNDLATFGLLFKSMCVRDLRIYADTMGASVYHYRDKSDREVDVIIVLPDERWGAFEIKLGEAKTPDGAESLTAFSEAIDLKTMKAPSFLAVLNCGKYAYTRHDGVHVIPLACLKP